MSYARGGVSCCRTLALNNERVKESRSYVSFVKSPQNSVERILLYVQVRFKLSLFSLFYITTRNL